MRADRRVGNRLDSAYSMVGFLAALGHGAPQSSEHLDTQEET